MRLKRIRDDYARFLGDLSDAGVKLTESQKKELDQFVVGIEQIMEAQKIKTVKATKKIVEAKMDKEYGRVVESLLTHMRRNQFLTAQIQSKARAIEESQKLAKDVSNYLDIYVESILPKKSIVDYDRMQKLESILESLKDTLVVTDDSVEAKKQKLQESYNRKKKQFETELAKMKVDLNESMKTSRKLQSKIEKLKAVELLEALTKDLPTFEARQIRKRLGSLTCEEIQQKFKKTLKLVREEIEESTGTDDASIEDEVNDIISTGKTKDKSDDKSKKKKSKKSDDDEADDDEDTDSDEDTDTEDTDTEDSDTDTDDEDSDDDEGSSDDDSDDDGSDDDTTDESDDNDLATDVDESNMIDSNLMKLWIARSESIRV